MLLSGVRGGQEATMGFGRLPQRRFPRCMRPGAVMQVDDDDLLVLVELLKRLQLDRRGLMWELRWWRGMAGNLVMETLVLQQ